MGHLDNDQRVIEARLTSLGRKRLAEGDGLNITQFALSDDEVDYRLWQENLPKEDAGAIIENLPTHEAFTDETQSMRYKILSLEQESDVVPVISVPTDQRIINLDKENSLDANPVTIEPTTEIRNADTGLDQTLGYTAVLQDRTIASLELDPRGRVEETDATIPAMFGNEEGIDDLDTSSEIGTVFTLGWDAPFLSDDEETTLTIIGNETGLSLDLKVNVIGE